MGSIYDFLSNDHRVIDDLFAETEGAVAGKNWIEAESRFNSFTADLNRHFRKEEDILFPAFEEASGMKMGPTRVMRSEHEQMRTLLEKLKTSILEMNIDDYSGYSESLQLLVQQHNMKEEQMLYPMADQHLDGEQDRLIARMSDL